MFSNAKINPTIHTAKHLGRITRSKDRKLGWVHLDDERLEFRNERTRHGNRYQASTDFKGVAVGVPFRRGDAVQVHHERTMALENVRIVLKIVKHGSQRGLDLIAVQLPVTHKKHSHIILLRFDVKQIVKRKVQVVPPDAVVMKCDGDTFLFLGGLF